MNPHILTLALLCLLNFQCTPSKVQVVNPLLIEIENQKFLGEIDKFVSDTHIENPQEHILRVFILSNDCSGTRSFI